MTADDGDRYEKLAPWDYPDCPVCGGHIFVCGSPAQDARWVCYRCDVSFNAPLPGAG